MRTLRSLTGAAVVCAALTAAETQDRDWAPLRFEAETCTEPRDAWLNDRLEPGKWNLWSTDTAKENWSGGVVLQASPVSADRATPEEGAPPLHTVIPDVPPGLYDVEVKVARTVGLSLDGETWAPFTGGFAQRRVRIEGSYELWIDDRYAHTPPGPCYYDCVVLHPVPPLENGLYNPGFGIAADGVPLGWVFSSDGGGKTETVVSDRSEAGRCLRISHTGERNLYFGGTAWSLGNNAALSVQPGESFVLRAWVKAVRNPMLTICVEGLHGGKRVSRRVGSAHASGAHDWQEAITTFTVPEGVDELAVLVRGREDCELFLDDLSLLRGTLPRAKRAKVHGWASKLVRERLDRGLVAMPCDAGVYLSWRLLESDPAAAAFDVWRQDSNTAARRLNAEPIRHTTDFVDRSPVAAGQPVYTVRLCRRWRSDVSSRPALVGASDRELAFLGIPLPGSPKVSRAGVGDLDGDGRYDVVVKHPGHVIWCWNQSGPERWQPSPDTYKLDAYTMAGRRLWHRDLGWPIEQGLWYSPYLVYDLDGDGCAEVAVKTGEGDPRDAEGRVVSGPEWVSVWDGSTGEEIARAPWPGREGFASYDTMCRHFLSVAYLDGHTPCLLVQRGNYGRVIVDAYQLRDSRLDRLWRYDNQDYGSQYWGQGAHYTQIGDLDGDGRDEIVLGCVALDDDGTPLWSVGKGHPDYVFLGDVDPARPGWEVFLGIEPPQQRGGNILVDARTGQAIWQLEVPTGHVGIDGMCSDIDPTSPGLESQAVDVNREKRPAHCWLWSADGRILREADRSIGGARSAYWDADLQRELTRSVITDFDGAPLPGRMQGSILLIADLVGDWREEIVTGLEGQLRIYSTTLPATDRRVSLMQDSLYRNGAALWSMGYAQVPMCSTSFDATAPGLNLTARRDAENRIRCRVVVSAPLDEGVSGRLTLSADRGTPRPNASDISLEPGQRQVTDAVLIDAAIDAGTVTFRAALEGAGRPLEGRVTIEDNRPVVGCAVTEAEDIAAQGGGAVRRRDANDKPGVHGGHCFSHWFTAGHWLEWKIPVPPGEYRLLWRYCCSGRATRTLEVDGQAHSDQVFLPSGGFGSRVEDWDNAVARDADGRGLVFRTDGKPLTVRMQADGNDVGVNLDYLTLLPVTE